MCTVNCEQASHALELRRSHKSCVTVTCFTQDGEPYLQIYGASPENMGCCFLKISYVGSKSGSGLRAGLKALPQCHFLDLKWPHRAAISSASLGACNSQTIQVKIIATRKVDKWKGDSRF